MSCRKPRRCCVIKTRICGFDSDANQSLSDRAQLLDEEPPARGRLERDLQLLIGERARNRRTPARSAERTRARLISPLSRSIHSAVICARCWSTPITIDISTISLHHATGSVQPDPSTTVGSRSVPSVERSGRAALTRARLIYAVRHEGPATSTVVASRAFPGHTPAYDIFQQALQRGKAMPVIALMTAGTNLDHQRPDGLPRPTRPSAGIGARPPDRLLMRRP